MRIEGYDQETRTTVIASLQKKVDYYRSEQYAQKMRQTEQVMKLCAFGIIVAVAGLFMATSLMLVGTDAVRDLLSIAIMSGIVATFATFAKVDQSIDRHIRHRQETALSALQYAIMNVH